MTFSALCLKPGVRFSKTPESFRARKAIFSSSVFKDREEYTPENSCMKRTSVSIKNIWLKQLCSQKVWDFATAFRVRKLFGTFRETGPKRSQTGKHTAPTPLPLQESKKVYVRRTTFLAFFLRDVVIYRLSKKLFLSKIHRIPSVTVSCRYMWKSTQLTTQALNLLFRLHDELKAILRRRPSYERKPFYNKVTVIQSLK